MTDALIQRTRDARRTLVRTLLNELGPEGHWSGELSSSALSTATAVTALAEVDREAHGPLIRGGLAWLARNINADGGWGDTVRSISNLSTTALVWAAFGAARADADYRSCVDSAESYIRTHAGSLERVVPEIEARYGKDRTFSVPISMMLALSGRLGAKGWDQVRSLPFELAAFPRGVFGALRLPVVSYALPALIAIGQVIHFRTGRWNPLRSLARARTLRTLITLQPPNGGFLEATPLTSFVTMSLAGMGLGDHLVARRGVEFLRQSVRSDGSWPIDTNLATWVTTLSVKALHWDEAEIASPSFRKEVVRDWILAQQYRVVHPYTGAAPGGWAWTDLPGGVPDADDTAGALIALHALRADVDAKDAALDSSVTAGIEWLLGLQNRDGGIPTFCRGWGTLPFDRSTPELTAHALRAWAVWHSELAPELASRVGGAARRAVLFLEQSQRSDGAWIPLWFGNEAEAAQENPVYGTAQVLIALHDIRSSGLFPGSTGPMESRAVDYLLRAQRTDGGWGGAVGLVSTVEETSLALRALKPVVDATAAVEKGTRWLLDRLEESPLPQPAPIGLYFARLWYFERMYPLVFAADALGALSVSANARG